MRIVISAGRAECCANRPRFRPSLVAHRINGRIAAAVIVLVAVAFSARSEAADRHTRAKRQLSSHSLRRLVENGHLPHMAIEAAKVVLQPQTKFSGSEGSVLVALLHSAHKAVETHVTKAQPSVDLPQSIRTDVTAVGKLLDTLRPETALNQRDCNSIHSVLDAAHSIHRVAKPVPQQNAELLATKSILMRKLLRKRRWNEDHSGGSLHASIDPQSGEILDLAASTAEAAYIPGSTAVEIKVNQHNEGNSLEFARNNELAQNIDQTLQETTAQWNQTFADPQEFNGEVKLGSYNLYARPNRRQFDAEVHYPLIGTFFAGKLDRIDNRTISEIHHELIEFVDHLARRFTPGDRLIPDPLHQWGPTPAWHYALLKALHEYDVLSAESPEAFINRELAQALALPETTVAHIWEHARKREAQQFADLTQVPDFAKVRAETSRVPFLSPLDLQLRQFKIAAQPIVANLERGGAVQIFTESMAYLHLATEHVIPIYPYQNRLLSHMPNGRIMDIAAGADGANIGRDYGLPQTLTNISREHLRLSMKSDGSIVIQDLNSTNGTAVQFFGHAIAKSLGVQLGLIQPDPTAH